MEPVTSVEVLTILLVMLGSILCLVFFNISEASIIAARRLRMRHLAEQGNGAAQAVVRVRGQEDRFYATIVLTQTLFTILASSVGTALALHIWGDPGPWVATGVLTAIIVVFAEVTPKVLAVRAADSYALMVGRLNEFIMNLLAPITYLFRLLPNWLGRVRDKGKPKVPFITEAELRMLIDIGEAEGVVDGAEAEMLDKVFKFGDSQARETMAPRPEIVGVEKGATLAQFLSIYAQSPHPYFPVYEGSIDNITGILTLKDVVVAQGKGLLEAQSSVTHLARAAYFVPETKPLGELVAEMQDGGHQMAVIVDEFGGTAGVVSADELMGELVGLVDLSRGRKTFETIDEHTFQIDGGLRIDDANALGLGLPPGPYETVAGFVLSILGHIPEEGEQLTYDGLKLVITQMKGVRIGKILVTKG